MVTFVKLWAVLLTGGYACNTTPAAVRNGTWVGCTNLTEGQSCNITCDTGYYEWDSAQNTCSNGTFTGGEAVTCNECIQPAAFQHGNWDGCKDVGVGDWCTFGCHANFIQYPSGNLTFVCQANFQITGSVTPRCSPAGNEGKWTGVQTGPMDAVAAGGTDMHGLTDKYADSPYKQDETEFVKNQPAGKQSGSQQYWSDGTPVVWDTTTGEAIPHSNSSIEYRYNKFWTKSKDGASGNGYGNMSKINDTNLTWNNGSAICEGNGFLCVFPSDAIENRTRLTPKDFNWFVVNYTHPLMHHNNHTRVLDCMLHITQPHGKAATKPYYFHVPTGARYFSEYNNKFCDLNSVYRTINDTSQVMSDTITVYGTTGAPPGEEDDEHKVLGDQVEFTCGCETKLQTRASVQMGHNDGALLSVMEGTDQLREIIVQLWVYSDPKLTNQVTEGSEFPSTNGDGQTAQFYYFMARQLFKEDWSVQLQINECMACYPGAACAFDSKGADDIIFYENCAHMLGGPAPCPIDATSWYLNPSNDAIYSDDYPTRVPYHALGFAKFRLTGTLTMTVACQVTACSKRPCKPCYEKASRRRMLDSSRESVSERMPIDVVLSSDPGMTVVNGEEVEFDETRVRRSLQDLSDGGSTTTASTSIRVAPGDEWVSILGSDGKVDDGSRERVSLFLFFVVIAVFLLTAGTLYYRMHMRKLQKEARQVLDSDSLSSQKPQDRVQQEPQEEAAVAK